MQYGSAPRNRLDLYLPSGCEFDEEKTEAAVRAAEEALAVARRLEGEALEEYVAPTGGGLFFVPPGPGEGEYLAQALFD